MDKDDWKRLGVFVTTFAVMFLFIHVRVMILRLERNVAELRSDILSVQKNNVRSLELIKLHLEFQHGLTSKTVSTNN